jgi:PAS domain S-box-containing protein
MGNEKKNPASADVSGTESGHSPSDIQEALVQLRNIADGMVYTIRTSPDGSSSFTYLSPAAERYHGLPVEKLFSDPTLIYGQMLEPERTSFLERERRAIATRTKFNDEIRIRLPSGEIRWRQFISVPREGADRECVWDGIELDITDRKLAEEALRKSEEKYRSIVETTTEWIWEMDLSGKHTYSNPRITKILGYELDEFLAMDTFALFHPEDRIQVDSLFPRYISEKKGWRAWITRLRHKDGSWRYLESNSNPIIDAAGNLIGYRGTDRDVTDRIQHEDALRIENKLVAELTSCDNLSLAMTKALSVVMELEGIDSGGIYLVDQAGGGLRLIAHHGLSESFTRQVAYFPADSERFRIVSDGKPRYQTYSDLFPNADDKENAERILALAVIPVMSPTGLIAVFNLSSHTRTSIPDRTRKTLETIALQIGNLLMRLRSDAALRESEEIFNIFMDNSPIYVFFKDNELRPIRLSRNYEQMLGRPINELLGRTMDQIFPPEVAEPMIADDLRILKEGKPLTIEEELNGRTYSTIKFPIQIPGKEPYLAGYTIDITEQKKTEEIIQRTTKLQSLGVLAGGLAHDFNNLLGSVFGYIELALSECGEEKVAELLTQASAAIERARGLTQQLLTFAKGGTPVRETAALFPFVQETVQFAISGSNVSCRFDIAPDLPPCSYDRTQIGQVIDNLVINACQAMPSGGMISVGASRVSFAEGEHPTLPPGFYVKLSIADEGPGIPAEILPRIFDPFFTTKTKGHGLGLATCHSIIQRHGGSIDVESKPGRGAVFHIYIPESSGPVIQAATVKEKVHPGSGTILIMDDNEQLRIAVAAILKHLGYNTICLTDGRDATDYFRKETIAGHSFTALIFDLTVPGGVGGKEVIGEIRKIDPDVPVFVSSGYADDPVMSDPAKYGFTASLQKPFRITELTALLSKHLKPR